MSFKIIDLPFSYGALEPHLDARTMEIHYTRHHQTYCDKLNEAVRGTELEGKEIERILALGAENLPAAVRNHGGGFHNHNLFWQMLRPGGGEPSGALLAALEHRWGQVAGFREAFGRAALDRFGSGWAWLVLGRDGVEITGTANQDSPLMAGQVPLLGLDVWEHAYYLKYQNRRADYVQAFWNVVNWDDVAARLAAAVEAR